MVATLLFLAMNALIISRLFINSIRDAGKTFFAIFTGWLPYIKKTRILDFKEVINITLGINTIKTNPESEKKIESQENNKENQENVDQKSNKPRVESLYLAEDSLKREKN
ncbi:MAG: hypothetical protein MHPSP_003594 [Paramarteilia canceri]